MAKGKKRKKKQKMIASSATFRVQVQDERPRAIAIMFDCFESLENRRCFCGSEEFRRVGANTRGNFAGEYSLTLACCMKCFRLFHIQ